MSENANLEGHYPAPTIVIYKKINNILIIEDSVLFYLNLLLLIKFKSFFTLF